jgi:hypothetical protein
MLYKTLQRRTDNNNGQKKKDKQWSTQHYKDVQTITMVKRKRTNNDLQNTTQKINDWDYTNPAKNRELTQER